MATEPIRVTSMREEEEVNKLKRRFNDHIETYREHRTLDAEYNTMQDRRIQETSESVSQLVESTQGLVDTWSTARNIQRFVKWISGFAVIVIFITWLSNKFPALLP